MGDTVYHGNIDQNSGVVMGNAYTPSKDGIRTIGSTSIVSSGFFRALNVAEIRRSIITGTVRMFGIRREGRVLGRVQLL
jgi:hypothetical protein